MSKEELKPLLGQAEVVVLDVRAKQDWDGSKIKITGAVREDPGAVEKWVSKYPKEKTIVAYCA
jgi:rhodanese-related sulfurtransferase